jgi:hypothetical protein
MVMPARTPLVVLYLISAPVSDLTASGNSDLIVFSPSIAAARSYVSPVYIALDF